MSERRDTSKERNPLPTIATHRSLLQTDPKPADLTHEAGTVSKLESGAIPFLAFVSALGQKQTFECTSAMSALPPKADILRGGVDVG